MGRSLKNEVARRGEVLAVSYLRRKGYRVLERNFKDRLGEIDIVAVFKGVVCFVEVRSRRGPVACEEVAASVDQAKQRRLTRLAVSFLKAREWMHRAARFDVISVVFAGERQDISHFKNAFEAIGKYA